MTDIRNLKKSPVTQISPSAKLLMISGAAESKPAMSIMPASLGSARVKPLDDMAHTMSLASIPVASRYCFRAAAGCTAPE